MIWGISVRVIGAGEPFGDAIPGSILCDWYAYQKRIELVR